ncbi:hypothetical protein GGI04_001732 [Coemansia thaxteri]|nr:hypothetical protein GGI04_001732 [Coemansia thaxteri]
MFIATLQMRIYRFLFVFVRKQQAEGVYFILPIVYIFLLSIVYAAIAFIVSPSVGFAYDPNTNICLANNPIYYTGVALVVIQTCVTGALLYKVRKAKSCFSEFKIFCIIAGVGVLAGVIALALRIVAQHTDKLVLTGVLTIVVVCLWQQVGFWLIIGRAFYSCIRHNERYQREFIDKIDANDLSEVYELACRCPLGEITALSDAERSRNASIRHSDGTAKSRFSGNIPAPEVGPEQQQIRRQQSMRKSNGVLLSYYGM